MEKNSNNYKIIMITQYTTILNNLFLMILKLSKTTTIMFIILAIAMNMKLICNKKISRLPLWSPGWTVLTTICIWTWATPSSEVPLQINMQQILLGATIELYTSYSNHHYSINGDCTMVHLRIKSITLLSSYQTQRTQPWYATMHSRTTFTTCKWNFNSSVHLPTYLHHSSKIWLVMLFYSQDIRKHWQINLQQMTSWA